MVDIKFHCSEEGMFKNNINVHAFSYKDYSIPMHNHDFFELNIVLSGSGMHCIENGKFPVKRGDVFLIPPMVAHAYIDTENLEVYHILLQKSFLKNNESETSKIKGFLQFTEIEPFLRSNSSKSFFLKLNQVQMLQLENDIKFIDDNGEYSWEESSFLKYHTTWKILYWFSELLYNQINNEKENNDKKYEIQIINALEYMQQNYGEKITIDNLCKKVYLSRSTFLRYFTDICGTTPNDYLNHYRCKKAIELLNLGETSKTDISHICGFYDLSHMEKMLKKYI